MKKSSPTSQMHTYHVFFFNTGFKGYELLKTYPIISTKFDNNVILIAHPFQDLNLKI
jgi:hypothetical protein